VSSWRCWLISGFSDLIFSCISLRLNGDESFYTLLNVDVAKKMVLVVLCDVKYYKVRYGKVIFGALSNVQYITSKVARADRVEPTCQLTSAILQFKRFTLYRNIFGTFLIDAVCRLTLTQRLSFLFCVVFMRCLFCTHGL
jgi:hypothetical protein